MKVKGLLFLLTACLSCAAISANAVTVVGQGSVGCGEWVEAHQSPPSMTSLSQEIWVVGYLSGVAVTSNKDLMVGTDNSSRELWITNYCRAYPLSTIVDASNALVAELIRRNGL